KTIECAIADRAFERGWVKPEPPPAKTGKKIAIVGSGPAGLACAQQLARVGHDVHVFEKFAKAGGLLTYGIPDFKMDKHIIARRVAQMEAEGVTFHYNAHVGVNLPAETLVADYNAVVLTGGAEHARDLRIPGRELKGIHFAMDFLPQQNRRVSGEPLGDVEPILAGGKHVVVIGGGDTGSDCIGTSFRQGALSGATFELMPQPPEKENKLLTWPEWPLKLRISPSHEEGVSRDFAVLTQKFAGENGQVTKLHCTRVDAKFKPVPDTEFEIDADLVLLAMGFVHPVHEEMLKALNVALDQRGNVSADTNAYQTSLPKVFAAGDMRRGQSLVVWAIREGRQPAHAVDKSLMGSPMRPRWGSRNPTPAEGDLSWRAGHIVPRRLRSAACVLGVMGTLGILGIERILRGLAGAATFRRGRRFLGSRRRLGARWLGWRGCQSARWHRRHRISQAVVVATLQGEIVGAASRSSD